jgi:hypothetical protein
MDTTEKLAAVIHENNALRKANEALRTENARLSEQVHGLRLSLHTAQTMATHWRIQATGNADDGPGD